MRLKKPSELLILGAGGHGRVVADIAESLGYKTISFLDDRWPTVTKNLHWDIIGQSHNVHSYDADHIVAIGNNKQRLKVLSGLVENRFSVVSLIHGSAYLSRYVSIMKGCVVMPQAVVNTGSTLGLGIIINTGATVDHDCTLENGVHISPGAHIAGGVSIGESSWIGIGSAIKEGCRIGRNVVVAAGAVVVNNIPDDVTVFGIPARESHKNVKN